MSLQLSSSAFGDGESIPKRFTCQGEDLSPPLAWTNVPDGTNSLALIMDDPDAPAGTWVHWVIYDLPASSAGLPEGVSADPVTPEGVRQGINDFRRVGYGGPCPPAGAPHRYFFKLYSLDVELGPIDDATKDDLQAAMQGHVLAEGQLMGVYERE
jgi:Raf kinase inhibitor-like YbhB/YbcL family protein